MRKVISVLTVIFVALVAAIGVAVVKNDGSLVTASGNTSPTSSPTEPSSSPKPTDGATSAFTDLNSYYDSLATAIDLVQGNESVASSVSISLTDPESDDPIDFEVTAVQLDIEVTNGTPNAQYLITLNMTDTNGSSVPCTITLTTDGSGEASLTFDIPQPRVGETRTFLGGTIREAYPRSVLTTTERIEVIETP